MSHDVFHHDHRAIHDHSKIQGTKGDKICGNMTEVEKYGREEQSKGNGKSNDESSTNIPKKEKENDRDQDHALAEVMQHGVQRVVKQIATIEHRNDLHPLRQNVIVQFLYLLVNSFQCGTLFGPFAHEHAALDNVRLIDNDAVRSVIRSGHVSETNSRTPVHYGNVLHSDRRSIRRRQDRVLDILYIAEKSERADVQLLCALFYKTAARVHIIVGELALDLGNAQSVGDQLVRIDAYLILTCRPPEVAYVHDVSDFPEFLVQSPVFDAPQVHQVISRIAAP